MKNRIKNRKGMSIGEVLVSVLIMLLATSVVTATVSLASEKYLRTLSGSEANVLASTLESLMTSELAYTPEIHVDASGNVTKFQSQNYNKTTSLSMFEVDSTGKVIVTYPEKTGESSVKLLGDGSYPNNLKVEINTFTYDDDSHTFTITISISRKSETILDRTFQIINVNNTEAP